jgi:pilus assembly protein FimV
VKSAEAETVVKASEPTTPAAAATASATAAAMPAASASAPAHASSAPVVAAKPTTAKPAIKAPAKPVPATEEEPWFMQTWAWGAGAAVIVLGLLAALRGRSRKTAEPAAASASSLADRFGTIPHGGAGGADPDQDELLDQLAEHPDDIGLHLELVSLYYSRRDVDHFEAAAEAMHAHITDEQQPEWVDVLHMGEDLVPEHPLFSHGFIAPRSLDDEGHEALDQFDLGSYAKDHDGVPPLPTPPVQQAPKVSGYHFDFDLTPRPAQAPASAQASTAKEEEIDALASSWHFDEPEVEEAVHGQPVHSLDHAAEHDLSHDLGGHFTDDPVDTKLDLARAYLDMGDPDGAQAMLEEVMHEGTQMQKDVAKRLLESIR